MEENILKQQKEIIPYDENGGRPLEFIFIRE